MGFAEGTSSILAMANVTDVEVAIQCRRGNRQCRVAAHHSGSRAGGCEGHTKRPLSLTRSAGQQADGMASVVSGDGTAAVQRLDIGMEREQYNGLQQHS